MQSRQTMICSVNPILSRDGLGSPFGVQEGTSGRRGESHGIGNESMKHLAATLMTIALLVAPAFGRSSSHSHHSYQGGHYVGGHGSSHKGGHYKNARTHDHYTHH